MHELRRGERGALWPSSFLEYGLEYGHGKITVYRFSEQFFTFYHAIKSKLWVFYKYSHNFDK